MNMLKNSFITPFSNQYFLIKLVKYNFIIKKMMDKKIINAHVFGIKLLKLIHLTLLFIFIKNIEFYNKLFFIFIKEMYNNNNFSFALSFFASASPTFLMNLF